MRLWGRRQRELEVTKAQLDDAHRRLLELEARLERQERSSRTYSWAERHAAGLTLGTGAQIHESVVIFVRPERPVHIGDKTKILRGADILGPVHVGDRTFINRDAYIRSETRIGSDVAIGPFVSLITDTHRVGPERKRAGANTVFPIVIEDGVWIGAHATILPGVTVGRGAIVAAGAVVTQDVKAHTLVGGVPARLLRELETSPTSPKGS